MSFLIFWSLSTPSWKSRLSQPLPCFVHAGHTQAISARRLLCLGPPAPRPPWPPDRAPYVHMQGIQAGKEAVVVQPMRADGQGEWRQPEHGCGRLHAVWATDALQSRTGRDFISLLEMLGTRQSCCSSMPGCHLQGLRVLLPNVKALHGCHPERKASEGH